MKKNKKIHSFRMNTKDIETLKFIARKQNRTQIDIVERALRQYYLEYEDEYAMELLELN